MKTKVAVLIVAVLAIWGMKRLYSDARADDLWWMLRPTARLVGITTGSAFAMEPGQGYLSRERLFLIEKSCAGINFMIAAFGMLAFMLSRRAASAVSGAAVLGVSLAASYAAAVLVNTARIAAAMWLGGSAQVHRLEGIAVYFGGLLLLYELAQRLDRRPMLLTSES